MTETLKLSWSGISSFAECDRRYQMSYIEGIVKPLSGDSDAMVIGSHVHAGWERAMRHRHNYPNSSLDKLVEESHYGVRDYRMRNLDNTKVRFNWDTQAYEPDGEYFSMMEYAFEQARVILSYQLPRFDWNRYQPVTLYDFFSGAANITPETALGYSPSLKDVDSLLLEWKFEIPFQDVVIVGIVDAVLYDHQQNEYVIFDWKTRGQFVDDFLISLDGQMPLYAAMINSLYGECVIRQCVNYQVSSDVPHPAKLTPAKGQLSMAAPGSTWEVWSNSVRNLGIDPEKYREEMYPKMRPASDWTNPVEVAINPDVDTMSLINLTESVKAIQTARATENYPAILSHKACKFCDFKKICSVMQQGGDPELVIQREFTIKRGFYE